MPFLPPTSSRLKQIARFGPLAVWHLITGQPASLGSLGAKLFDGLVPPPRLLGLDCIPETPFVLVCNHYESPTAAAWWGALLMSRVVAERRSSEPREIHWVMASEWSYASGWGHYVIEPVTRGLFARIAQVVGFVLVPPVLEGDPNRGEGVAGVRQALALTRGDHPQLIGIALEGHAGPGGTLKEPPQGAGLFLSLLTHDTIPCLPVGWWQAANGQIVLHFGAPFHLKTPRLKDRRERDRAAATRVMVEIGKLLPERFWGAYHEPLAEWKAQCHE